LQMIGGVANMVSLPVFARLQDDDERMRSWFLRSTSLVSLVAFPALTLLLVGARQGIPTIFGAEWRPAATPLMILCVAGGADVVRMLMSPVAQAKARTDYVFWWALATFGTQGVAFFIGVQWGIVGVAVAYSTVTLVLWPLNVAHFARRLLAMRLRQYAGSLAPASVGSLVLAGTWLAVNHLLGLAGAGDPLRLVVSTLVALPLYLLTIKVAFSPTLDSTREIAQLMLRRST
jgi:O-antigen/teichoic acid export membrane protein